MADLHLPHDDALTLEQWRRLNLTRPYTDDPIGGSSGSITRRQHSATASRIIEQIHDPFERGLRDPTTAMPDANEAINERERLRRLRRKAARTAAKPLQAAIDAADALTHPQPPQDAA